MAKTKAPSGLSKGLGKSSKSKNKSKKGGSKHKIRHMHIEPADNGGFNVRHIHEQPGMDDTESAPVPDSTHAIGGPDDLLSHVQSQFGGQMPPAGAGPAPAGGM